MVANSRVAAWVESFAMWGVMAEFKDPELEAEFSLEMDRRTTFMNLLKLILAIICFFIDFFQRMFVYGLRRTDLIVHSSNMFIIGAGCLTIRLLLKPPSRRYQRLVVGLIVFLVHNILLVRHLWAPGDYPQEAMRKDIGLDVDVSALFSLLLFGGLCFMSISVRTAIFLALNCVITTSVLFTVFGPNKPVLFKLLTAPVSYGFIAIAGALQTRNQEQNSRRAYLLEKLLSDEFNICLNEFVTLKTEHLQQLVHMAQNGSVRLETVKEAVKEVREQHGRRKVGAVRLGDKEGRPVKRGWWETGKDGAKRMLRRCLVTMDTDDEDYKRRCRLGRETYRKLRAITFYILQEERQPPDQSIENMLVILVNSLTTSVGIFMLYMWGFFIEFGVLVVASLLAKITIRPQGDIYVYMLFLCSFLACASQNVGTEQDTQRFFALQELAAWLSSAARQGELRAGEGRDGAAVRHVNTCLLMTTPVFPSADGSDTDDAAGVAPRDDEPDTQDLPAPPLPPAPSGLGPGPGPGGLSRSSSLRDPASRRGTLRRPKTVRIAPEPEVIADDAVGEEEDGASAGSAPAKPARRGSAGSSDVRQTTSTLGLSRSSQLSANVAQRLRTQAEMVVKGVNRMAEIMERAEVHKNEEAGDVDEEDGGEGGRRAASKLVADSRVAAWVDSFPIWGLVAEFKDRELEAEFSLEMDRRTTSMNLFKFTLVIICFVFDFFQRGLGYGFRRTDAAIISSNVLVLVVGCLTIRFVLKPPPIDALRKDVGQDVDVGALFSLVLFGGICFLSIKYILVLLVLFSIWGSNDPVFFKIGTAPLLYGFIAIAGALQTRNQEQNSRRAYLLEKLLSDEFDLSMDDFVTLKTEHLQHLVHMAQNGSVKLETVKGAVVEVREYETMDAARFGRPKGKVAKKTWLERVREVVERMLRHCMATVNTADEDYKKRAISFYILRDGREDHSIENMLLFTTSVGIFMLYMWGFYVEFSILAAATLVAKISVKVKGDLYVYMIFFSSFLACASQNVGTEQDTQRFFALQELAAWLSSAVRQGNLRAGEMGSRGSLKCSGMALDA
ncbi:hypothetical protein HDU96_009514 [Phlyctochytrium bullatum]|nr:hypothetical protein HDU96_009514 [Phlyctochytrium bullatum]